ncbi:MAG: 3'-5' exonuclease domain-containing protein 2, partial [Bacteroidota bacterium]
MFLESISNPEVNELKLRSYEGTITLIEDKRDFKRAFSKIKRQSFIGFDTETKPAFRKGEVNDVSLIQLAIPDEVFLIRINKTGLIDSM